MLQFGLRLGGNPRCLVATTPRPTKLIRELLAREGHDVAITRGSTYENRANLAPGFFAQVIRKYEGTRLGRQELNAEILDDVPGALWSRARIEETRWPVHRNVPELIRIVVAIDPAGIERRGLRRDRDHRRWHRCLWAWLRAGRSIRPISAH
jgi:phage terminase large subunit-like protein